MEVHLHTFTISNQPQNVFSAGKAEESALLKVLKLLFRRLHAETIYGKD